MNFIIKRAVVVFTLTTIALSALFFLNYRSQKGLKGNNGFARNFKGILLHKRWEEQPSGKYFTAGCSGNQLYFYSSNPRNMISVDENGDGTIKIDLPNDSCIDKVKAAYKATVSESYLDIYAFNQASIYNISLSTGHVVKRVLPGNYSRIVSIGNNSYVVKGFNSSYEKQELYRVGNGNQITRSSYLERTPDAGFATDGNLLYDSLSGAVIYVYLNCNKILWLDTSLNLLATTSTIDTNTHYSILAKEYKSGEGNKFFTLSKPAEYINYCCYASSGLLYVNSLVKSGSENINDFREHSVIDVYDIGTRKYAYSFYLPKHHEERIRSFVVLAGQIVATYPDAIIAYAPEDIHR